MEQDLTVIFLTLNHLPSRWEQFHREHLLRAASDRPMVVISKEPMDLDRADVKYAIQAGPFGYWNIYRQLCIGAKMADTPFVALAEDDTLYSQHHFDAFRPPMDAVSYNRARWSLFTWDAIYCLRQRICNCTLIAPRQLLIDAIEERLAKHPNGDSYLDEHVGEVGRTCVEQRLKVTARKFVEWWSTVPVVQLNHTSGIDTRGRNRLKKHGRLRAHDIPYWGKAVDIATIFLGEPAHVDSRHGDKTGGCYAGC